MHVLQVQGDYVHLSIPSCSFGKVEAAIIKGDCRAVAELLTSVEGLAALDKCMRTTLACTAADRRQAACLRVILKKGIDLNGSVSLAAAAAGSLPCLGLAYSHEDRWTWQTMSRAASKGHADCLLYLLKHGCSCDIGYPELSMVLGSCILTAAISGGHMACVDVWVDHGRPSTPCLYVGNSPEQPVGVRQLRCLEHLLGKGSPIHPGTIISAARRGDLETLRFLHSRGAPLWHGAYDEEAEEDTSRSCVRLKPITNGHRYSIMSQGVITIPQIPNDAESMWAALRYGWVVGAPVTPFMEEVFKAQRAGMRATLLCFHVATRLSKGEGTCEQRAAWALMDRMPIELIMKIILHANFEILETIYRSFQIECSASVRVSCTPSWWYLDRPIRLYAAPGMENKFEDPGW